MTRVGKVSLGGAAPWPSLLDYNEAMQNPGFCFEDPVLRQGQVVDELAGMPRPRGVGAFGAVYQLRCPGDVIRAVKCFTRQVPGLHERYQAIGAYLKHARLGFTVGFRYLDRGIRVRGRWYPALEMDWVEGATLNLF